MAKQSPADTRNQALEIQSAWQKVGTENSYAGHTLADVEKALGELDTAEKALRDLETELKRARNERMEKRWELWLIVKEARLASKVSHGEDSSEYEMFGGTRSSEYRRGGGEDNPPPIDQDRP